MIFYVATTGSNASSGGRATPWATISYAATRVIAGDTVRVEAGNYNERVAVNRGGGVGMFVNFVADGRVVCLGFALTNVTYVRVIGFEVTHPNLNYKRGITLGGTCSYIEILDNDIHDVYDGGIQALSTATNTSHVTIRGNRVFWCGHPGSPSYQPVGISCTPITSDHWLVEYNDIQRTGDSINVFGHHHIVRNNRLGDYADSYWTSAPNAFHADMFQPGSDGKVAGTNDHVYEANFCADSIERNSHFGIWQDTTNSNDRNILIRGNVAHDFGGGGIGVVSTKHLCAYHNSFYKFCQVLTPSNGSMLTIHSVGPSTDYSVGNLYANNLIFDDHAATLALSAVAPNTCAFTHNLGYLAGTHPSYVSTADPLFVDAPNNDFRLQSGSPAIGAGIAVASVTSADGSGTSFDVNDGLLLCDGYGMTDGDTITVGGTTTQITNITGNTVTVAGSVTWTNGMPVYWGTNTAPDIGALPFGSTELTSAALVQVGNDYTVNVTGDARGVWFYVDGIPTAWVSQVPFTATIASGAVTAKAYALYAQALPVVSASASSDATLSVLVLSNGSLSPAFNFAVLNYTASVGSGTTSMTVTPTANDGASTITVNGSNVVSGAPSPILGLAVGDNPIDIIVTNGSSVVTYRLTVNRAAVISSDATLAALSLSSGTLSPTFTSGVTGYTATVANSVPSLTLTPTTSNAGAAVTVNGTPVASGSPSGAIALNVGAQFVAVVVTAANGTTTKTYAVNVTRAASANADLSDLQLSDGTLSPVFDANGLTYSSGTALSSIDITPTLADNTATVKVNGQNVAGGVPASVLIALGNNPFTVLVTAQNGVRKQTLLTVTRTGGGPSSDATLLSLEGSDGTYSPPFNPSTIAYSVGVIHSVDVFSVIPTANDAGATITVNGIPVASGMSSGDIALAAARATGIEVIVTAEDLSTKTYVLTVWRAGGGGGHGGKKVRLLR